MKHCSSQPALLHICKLGCLDKKHTRIMSTSLSYLFLPPPLVLPYGQKRFFKYNHIMKQKQMEKLLRKIILKRNTTNNNNNRDFFSILQTGTLCINKLKRQRKNSETSKLKYVQRGKNYSSTAIYWFGTRCWLQKLDNLATFKKIFIYTFTKSKEGM